MAFDNLLMIPHLSKELNLLGFPELPYSLKKVAKVKSKSKCNEEKLKIIFNKQLMIEALTSACFELVKQVKKEGDDDDVSDKLNFECIKLQKQLKTSKSEIEKIMVKLTTTKAANQQLQTKIDDLQKKIKDSEIKEQISKKNQTDKQILKATLKKKELELFELHKILWKKHNLVKQNYLPENFELLKLNQPDFTKLWSTVKYANSQAKEEALKGAVGVFQKNNKVLMEENYLLKNSFLNVLQEIHEILELMVEKLHLPDSILFSYKTKELIEDLQKFNISLYNKVFKEHLKVIVKICNLFDEASFMVSDDIFVCWSKIIKSL